MGSAQSHFRLNYFLAKFLPNITRTVWLMDDKTMLDLFWFNVLDKL